MGCKNPVVIQQATQHTKKTACNNNIAVPCCKSEEEENGNEPKDRKNYQEYQKEPLHGSSGQERPKKISIHPEFYNGKTIIDPGIRPEHYPNQYARCYLH
jgi:hypothetical protein